MSLATPRTACWVNQVCPAGPWPLKRLLHGLFVQRPIDEVQQRMVLPQADGEYDHERDRTHNQSGAQLFEVIDDAQSLFVTDRADCGRHRI